MPTSVAAMPLLNAADRVPVKNAASALRPSGSLTSLSLAAAVLACILAVGGSVSTAAAGNPGPVQGRSWP